VDDGSVIDEKNYYANYSTNNTSMNQNWDISTTASSSGFSTNKVAKALGFQINSSTEENIKKQQVVENSSA
jgi:hypothetical protein